MTFGHVLYSEISRFILGLVPCRMVSHRHALMIRNVKFTANFGKDKDGKETPAAKEALEGYTQVRGKCER